MTATDPEPAPGTASSSFRGRIARVAAASAGAQVIGEIVSLVQTIVLARLLGPTVVGIFAAGTVLTMFLGSFAEGGLRSALIHREARLADAAETVFRGTILAGLLMSLAALAAAPVIGWAFDSAEAGLVAAVSSGALLLFSLTNVPESMLQREFNVLRRLVVGPVVSIVFAAVSITMAALESGVWSLVAGTYASYLAWVVGVWAITDWRPGRGRASWALWREMTRYGFPLVVGMTGAKVQQLVEQVVVGRGLSTTALGFYRYAVRISRIPVSANLEIVANALFPAFARLSGDPDRMRAGYLRALTWVTFGAAGIAGLLVAVGVPAVTLVLGEQWREAGVALVAMAGLGLGKAFTSVSEEAIKGCGRTPLLNYLTAAEIVLGIGLLTLIIPFGLFGVGLAISLTALGVGVLALALARPVVGFGLADLRRAVAPSLAGTLVAGTVTALLEHHLVRSDTRPTPIGLGGLVVDTIVFGTVHVVVVAMLSPAIRSGLAGAVATIRSQLARLLRPRARY